MTKEEQAQYISEKLMENPKFKKAFVGAITDAVNEVVKVIKALEQEPCTDAINRQAAINVAVDAVDDWDGECNKTREEYIRKALETLPPVKPTEKVEPCEDCVSREVVLRCFTLDNTKADVWNNIKALPPVTSKLIECGDCVSRQAVLSHAKTDRGNGHEQPFDYVEVDVIKQLPPVKPQYTDTEIQKMQDLESVEIQTAYEIGKAENPNKWIPVSERLPELTINDSVAGKQYTEDVLVYDGADLRVGYFVRNDKLDFSYWVAYGEDVSEPIAWMPIEPYKASPTGAERSTE